MRRASLFSWEMSCHLCLKWQIWLRPSGRTAEGSERGFLYFVLIRLRYSHSTPRPFPSYSSDFFQFYLFISGGGLSWIARFRVFIRRGGCVVRGHCVLVVQAVCISDVCHQFLSGAFFSLRVCMQGSRSLSSWPIVKCRHFRVHGHHFLGSIQVLKSIGFASSSWGVRSCLIWWVGFCFSPPISSGAFVSFRSSRVGETPDDWSCDALWGTTSIRLSTVACRLWKPLDATWAHVLGVESDVTIPPPRLLGHAWFMWPLSPHQ